MVVGIFEQDEFLRLMRNAGLEARYLKKSLAPGRGFYVGVKLPIGSPGGPEPLEGWRNSEVALEA